MAQYAVEGAGGGNQFAAVGEVFKPFQQLFDGRVAHARVVAAAFGLGGRAAEIVDLFVARALAVGVSSHNDVVVEIGQPLLIKGGIDGAQVEGNANFGQVALPFARHALEGFAVGQIFQYQRPALLVGQHAVLITVAGLQQQAAGFQQIRPDAERGVALRRHRHGLAEDGGRQAVGQRSQQGEFGGIGQAGGGHFAVGKETGAAAVGTVHHAAVDVFKIETQNQGLPHPDVFQCRTALVQDETLHADGVAVRQFGLFQPALFQDVGRIGARPRTGGGFLREVEIARLHAFNPHGRVAQVAEAHGVEVVHAAPRGQLARPIVFVAGKLAQAAGIGFYQTVGAGTDGGGVAALFQTLRVTFARKHGKLAQNHVQFGIAFFEAEADGSVVGRFHRRHVRPIEFPTRLRGFVLRQQFERGGHVFGQHRIAVVETRFRIEPEGNGEAV